MPLASIRLPARSGRTVREVVARWRRLSGQGRTLVACSGGGDSCGLLLALTAGLSRPAETLVVGHVVHDLRPREEALADRDAAAELAAALGLPFVSAEVRVRREKGNAEGAARRARYAALETLARENGCRFVATGHTAGDQLETVLMGLLRGAGPEGLAGTAARRKIGTDGVKLIRPALGVSGQELRALCGEAGWAWREDATNTDRSRLRAAVRYGIVPKLEGLRPGASERASRSARLIADAAGLVRDRVAKLMTLGEPGRPRPGSHGPRADGTGAGTPRLTWIRGDLRGERRVVLGALIRYAAVRLRGRRGRDRLGSRALDPVVRAIRSRGTDPKRLVLGGVEVAVTAHEVTIRRADG